MCTSQDLDDLLEIINTDNVTRETVGQDLPFVSSQSTPDNTLASSSTNIQQQYEPISPVDQVSQPVCFSGQSKLPEPLEANPNSDVNSDLEFPDWSGGDQGFDFEMDYSQYAGAYPGMEYYWGSNMESQMPDIYPDFTMDPDLLSGYPVTYPYYDDLYWDAEDLMDFGSIATSSSSGGEEADEETEENNNKKKPKRKKVKEKTEIHCDQCELEKHLQNDGIVNVEQVKSSPDIKKDQPRTEKPNSDNDSAYTETEKGTSEKETGESEEGDEDDEYYAIIGEEMMVWCHPYMRNDVLQFISHQRQSDKQKQTNQTGS